MLRANSCNSKWPIHTRLPCLDANLFICFPFVCLSGGVNQSNNFSFQERNKMNRILKSLCGRDDDVNTNHQWNKSHLCNCTVSMLFFLLYSTIGVETERCIKSYYLCDAFCSAHFHMHFSHFWLKMRNPMEALKSYAIIA